MQIKSRDIHDRLHTNIEHSKTPVAVALSFATKTCIMDWVFFKPILDTNQFYYSVA